MLTAAVRELHAAHPGQFLTDVRTSADALWLNNPHITSLDESDSSVETLEMHYPLIHECNQRPLHFIHGYPLHLEDRLGVRVPVRRFQGDVHLSDEEKGQPIPGKELGVPERFWIIVAGGKYDFTAKWWNPESYQQVVDHFKGRIHFVQCGESGHWHPPLQNVVNLTGKTTLREFVRLIHHADGVVCPVTLAMHLAAAVETRPGRPRHRACVVVAGGREPPHWEAYPHHQFISTNGALSCCGDGGCWKSRCQKVGDGDVKDQRDLCEQPVELSDDLQIARCMNMITPEDVIRRIELYYDGGSLQYLNGHTRGNGHARKPATEGATMTNAIASPLPAKPARQHPRSTNTSVRFYHGLGDCAYFAHLIPLYEKRGHHISVECTPDKRILFEAAGATVLEKGQARHEHPWGYPGGSTHSGHGHFWQGSKMGHNISQAPLPDIGSVEELWDEFVATRVDVKPSLTSETRERIQRWFDRLPRPIVLFHQKGNTAQERKSIPDAVAKAFYERFIDECDGTLILLDWDERVRRLASHRIRHLNDLGHCSVEALLSMLQHADLMIGVDSGPLHTARFTDVPTLGVWMPGHYPSTYTLPRRHQANVVLADPTQAWNRFKRVPWNLVEHPGAQFSAGRLAELTRRMLSPPVYIPEDRGADLQMQQFISEFCRCSGTSPLTDYWDRNRSFQTLFAEANARFERPMIVETGTIRAEEDWGGAGFFTYLAGAWLHRCDGKLHSVDITPQHCEFARTWTQVFGNTVTVHQQDSLAFLRQFEQPIDVLYLDSLDTTEPNHAQHALLEIQAAEAKLHDQSLVVFDDTPWNAGAFVGKGATAVPWMLERGWKILYAGYQVVLSRQESVVVSPERGGPA